MTNERVYLDRIRELGEFLSIDASLSVPPEEREQILRALMDWEPEPAKEVTIEVSNVCSLYCVQCSTRAERGNTAFMSPNEVERHAKDFPDFTKVRPSGGEPFEHPDFPEIAYRLHRLGRSVEVLTSGVQQDEPLSDEILKEIAPYVDNIVFSVHGPPEVHNLIVSPGSETDYWDITIESVMRTIAQGIPHSYHTVAMTPNFGHLEPTAEIIATLRDYALSREDLTNPRYPVNWRILRFVAQGRGEIHPELALSQEHERQIPRIAGELAEKHLLNVSYTNAFEREVCDCGRQKAAVTYDGKIIPCSALKTYGGEASSFACMDRT